jgi:hypothetical protein
MKYAHVRLLSDDHFEKLIGIDRSIFDKMIDILQEADMEKRVKGGRKSNLSIENQLLMALDYIREDQTYLQVSKIYGISISACYKAIKWIEDTLNEYPEYALPDRKELLNNDMDYQVILIDTTQKS